jgi:hypothetical protein
LQGGGGEEEKAGERYRGGDVGLVASLAIHFGLLGAQNDAWVPNLDLPVLWPSDGVLGLHPGKKL